MNFLFHRITLASGYILIIFLATPTSLNWSLKMAFWAFSIFLFFLIDPKDSDFAFKKSWLFLMPVLILLITRLLPFYHWGEFALGVDAATYIYNFNICQASSWGDICWSNPIYWIARSLILVGWSTSDIVFVFYIALNFFVGLAVYVVANRYFGATSAFFSLLLFSLSLSQFLVYWLVYWKMMIAILLTLMILWLLKVRHWLVLPFLQFIRLVHPPTFIPLLISFTIQWLKNKKDYYFLSLTMLAMAIVFLGNWEDISGFIHYAGLYPNHETRVPSFISGNFVPLDIYSGFLSLIYLPFGILGLLRLYKNKEFNFIFTYCLAVFLLVVLGFVFYSRYIVLLDIILIILAGPIVKNFVAKYWFDISGRTLLLVVFSLLMANIFYQSWKIEPLIDHDELLKISQLSKVLEKGTKIVSTDYRYTPILRAYSQMEVINIDDFSSDDANSSLYSYQGRRSK